MQKEKCRQSERCSNKDTATIMKLLLIVGLTCQLKLINSKCVSIRPYQQRVLINKRLSIDGAYQQLVGSRKAWQGMRYCKCTSNALYISVCQWNILVFVSYIYIGVCHESVCMSGCVCVIVDFLLLYFMLSSS